MSCFIITVVLAGHERHLGETAKDLTSTDRLVQLHQPSDRCCGSFIRKNRYFLFLFVSLCVNCRKG